MDNNIPEPPDNLGHSGLFLWRSIVEDYELPPSDLETLASACRLRDRVDELRAVFAADPQYLVRGSQGQPVLNGLVPEIRQTESTVSQLLGKLRLTLPDDEPPATSDRTAPMSRSDVGRLAANARWGRRGW